MEGWRSDVVSYYKTADVFFQTSLYEGYGLSAVEANVAGCPVVSTDVGVASELGAVCPVGDKECLVGKLEGAIKKRESNKIISLSGDKSRYLQLYKESFAGTDF